MKKLSVLLAILNGAFLIIIIMGSVKSSNPKSIEVLNSNIELVSQIGGISSCGTVSGNYAYICVGPRILVYDTIALEIVGKTPMLPELVNDVVIQGNHAFLAVGDSGLMVLSLINPTNPLAVAQLDTPGFSRQLTVNDNQLFIADGDNGLQIIDITNPEIPILGDNVSIGYATDLEISGDYVFLTDAGGYLRVIDLNTLSEVSNITLPGYPRAIKITNNTAYVIAGMGGLRIIDISAPLIPVEIGFYQEGNRFFYDVVVKNDVAYVAAGLYQGLLLLDVSNATTVSKIGQWFTYGATAMGVFLAENHAYITQDMWITIVDVSGSGDPTYVSAIEEVMVANDVALYENFAYIASGQEGIQTYDVSNPENPERLDNYITGWWANCVNREGNFLYTCFSSNFEVLSLSLPQRPNNVASYNYSDKYLVDNDIKDDLAFVATSEGGLSILDLQSLPTITELSTLTTTDYLRSVVVADNYAYISDDALRIVDVNIPEYPEEVAHVPNCDGPLTYHNNYVFALDDHSDLCIIDVSTPVSPTVITNYPVGDDFFYDIAINQQYLFIVESGRLVILDLFVLDRPQEIHQFRTPGFGGRIALKDDLIYLANGGAGLLTLRQRLVDSSFITPEGGEFYPTDSSVKYEFPAGFVTETAIITHSLRAGFSVPPLMEIGPFFSLSAVYSETGQIAEPTSLYTLTVQYAQRTSIRTDNNIGLYYWDGNQWLKQEPNIIDPIQGTITTTSNHIGLWGVLIPADYRCFLPVVIN